MLQQAAGGPGCDRLFSVGDLVDRGPESDQYAQWLVLPWFHAVQGNHEAMAIAYARGELRPDLYARNGGYWNVCRSAEAQRATADDFEALPIAIELETAGGLVGIVHADVPYKSWEDFSDRLKAGANSPEGEDLEKIVAYAQWARMRLEKLCDEGVRGIRAVIVGHTPLDEMLTLGNVMHIDTGAWKGVTGGVRDFTIIDVATLKPAEAVAHRGHDFEQAAPPQPG